MELHRPRRGRSFEFGYGNATHAANAWHLCKYSHDLLQVVRSEDVVIIDKNKLIAGCLLNTTAAGSSES
jgi:hypothetical protein